MGQYHPIPTFSGRQRYEPPSPHHYPTLTGSRSGYASNRASGLERPTNTGRTFSVAPTDLTSYSVAGGNMSQRPKTKQDTIGKHGYTLRRQGTTWKEIAAQLGGTVASVEKLVSRYAIEWGKPWPIHHKNNQPYNKTKCDRTLVRGELYYAYMSRYGKRPSEASRDLNVSTSQVRLAAQAWAAKHDLEWPVPVLTKGQRAYRMRQTGAYWRVIAALLGYTYRTGAIGAARSYAKANQLTWPPPRHTNPDGRTTSIQQSTE